MFKPYVYDLLNMGHQEATDKDNDSASSLTDSIGRFTAILKGYVPQSEYPCLAGLDLTALAKKWKSMTPQEQNAEANVIFALSAAKLDELYAAWQDKENGRAKVDAIVAAWAAKNPQKS